MVSKAEFLESSSDASVPHDSSSQGQLDAHPSDAPPPCTSFDLACIDGDDTIFVSNSV